MNNLYGIDVSVYQGTINWPKVKAAGKTFVFVRAGWCGYDGEIKQDANFQINMQGAIAAGLHTGVYLYSYANTAAAAGKAAKELLELVKPYKLTYPIAFDIEDSMYTKFSKTTNNQIVKAFLSEIEKAGYYGMLYTYKSFVETDLNMAELAAYDVWIAQYAEKCTYMGPYGIWQYAGDMGRCDGVNGACDLNIAYKDYAAIISAAGLNQPEETELQLARERILQLEKELAAAKKALAEIKELSMPY